MASPNSGEVNAAADASNPNAFHSASLYVGDLHPEVSEALLFEIFNAVGPVASIRVCRDAVTRRSLGYAYVNFHNMTDAERALDTMNYTPIRDRPCRIMWSQRDPSLRKTGQGNVFVKNLDLSIDNKALYDTFSLFGNILSCKVVTDREGNSQGHGFVHFETLEAADDAIRKINGMLIAGKEVFVGNFQKRAERPGTTDYTNLYIKNVPKHWADDRLSELLSNYGPVASCVVMKDGEGKSKGFGFVDFVDHESASHCIEGLNKKDHAADEESEKMDPEDEKRRVIPLVVTRAQKKSERERELSEKFEQLQVERQTKYQGVNLYVKNLDEAVTDEILHKEFAAFGSITSVRVMRDAPVEPIEGEEAKPGVSKGFGFVCFSSSEEAMRAVTDMQGRMILGKPIFVALAQRKETRRAQLESVHRSRMARGVPQPFPGGFPMPYPGAVPGTMPGQMPPRGYGYAPSLMMGPRGPRGAPGQFPMMQPFPGQPMPRGAPGQGRGGRGGGRGGARGPKMDPNFKYTANARNQQPMPRMPPNEPLTAAALANASEQEQKNMIGERLYPLIEHDEPQQAGKITGMLLEMDNPELLHLLESPEALKAKVQEAIAVLKQHAQGN